jgi:hypothetical protein
MPSAARPIAVLAGLVLVLSATATAFAADAVPTVDVSGYVDGEGQPVEVESAILEEFETPDSEPVVTPIDVADDGTFTVSLREWGTPEQPALARLTAFEPPAEPFEDEDGCTHVIQEFGVYELDIPGQVPTDPIVMVYNQATNSALCPPATATPEPDRDVQAPAVTLPPTDAQAGSGPEIAGSLAAALLLAGVALVGAGFVAGRRAGRAR